MSTVNVLSDSLAIAGITFPSSGDSDRFRIAFPESYSVQSSNSTEDILSKNTATNATLTVSTYQTDALAAVLEAAYAQQLVDDANPSARAAKPGSAALVLTPENPTGRGVRWLDCRILQRGDIASSRNGAVVTWVFNLSKATVTF
jgi:hypothetical protein